MLGTGKVSAGTRRLGTALLRKPAALPLAQDLAPAAVSARPRPAALVSAAPLEKGVGALAARHGAAARPPGPASEPRRPARRPDGRGAVGRQEPRHHQVLQLRRGEWGLIQLFDGTRTARRDPRRPTRRSSRTRSSRPRSSSSTRRCCATIDLLAAVRRRAQPAGARRGSRTRAAARPSRRPKGFNIFLIPFHVFDPDEFLNRTQKYVRWIWRPARRRRLRSSSSP